MRVANASPRCESSSDDFEAELDRRLPDNPEVHRLAAAGRAVM